MNPGAYNFVPGGGFAPPGGQQQPGAGAGQPGANPYNPYAQQQDTTVSRWGTSKVVVISKEDMEVIKQVDRAVMVDIREELALVDTSKADSLPELNSSSLSKLKTRPKPKLNNLPLFPVDNHTSPLRRARPLPKPSA
jgi:antitoxin component of MazEF toxin-antitoxin module